MRNLLRAIHKEMRAAFVVVVVEGFGGDNLIWIDVFATAGGRKDVDYNINIFLNLSFINHFVIRTESRNRFCRNNNVSRDVVKGYVPTGDSFRYWKILYKIYTNIFDLFVVDHLSIQVSDGPSKYRIDNVHDFVRFVYVMLYF